MTCLTMQYPVLSACYCKNVGCNGAYEPQACLMRYNQFLCTEFTKIELYELFIGAQFGFDYRAKQTKSVNIAHNIIAHVGEVNTNLRLTSMEQFYRAGWRSGTVRYGQALRAAPYGDHAVPCTVTSEAPATQTLKQETYDRVCHRRLHDCSQCEFMLCFLLK